MTRRDILSCIRCVVNCRLTIWTVFQTSPPPHESELHLVPWFYATLYLLLVAETACSGWSQL